MTELDSLLLFQTSFDLIVLQYVSTLKPIYNKNELLYSLYLKAISSLSNSSPDSIGGDAGWETSCFTEARVFSSVICFDLIAPENRLELIKSSRCKSHTPFHDGAIGSSPLRPNLNTSMNDDWLQVRKTMGINHSISWEEFLKLHYCCNTTAWGRPR